MPHRARLCVLVAIVVAPVCLVHADDFDAAGALTGIPFEGPFEVVDESRRSGHDGPVFVRLYDASFDACVAEFVDTYADGDTLAPDWSLTGYGRDAATGAWRFGLLFAGEALFRMEVQDDDGRCRLEVGSTGLGLVGGYYRIPWPALQPVGAPALRVDPMVPDRVLAP